MCRAIRFRKRLGTLERGAPSVLDRVLDCALAVRGTDPGRVGYDAVAGQYFPVGRVELWLV